MSEDDDLIPIPGTEKPGLVIGPVTIVFYNYFTEFVPSYIQLGIEGSWGHIEIRFLKFGIQILWGADDD